MPALYRGPKRGYTLTDYDRLVLAASLWGEAGSSPDEKEAAAVAWAMLDRFLLFNSRWVSEGWDFARFIRAFSQPVNPTWAYPDEARMAKHPEACTPDKLARRRKLQGYLDGSVHDGWARILMDAPIPAKYALAFAEGELADPFPEPIYDFAACSLTAKQKASGSRPGSGINIGGNCFLTYNDLNTKERERVIVGRVQSGVAAYASGAVFAVLGLIGATAAWAWGRFYS